MLKQLEELAQQGEWAEIYDDAANVEGFYTSKVIQATEDYTLLASISPKGMYDGYSLIITDNIFQINTGSQYIRDLKKIYTARDQKHLDWKHHQNDLLRSILAFAQAHKLVIAVVAFGENLVEGFFKDIEEDVLVVSALTSQGEPDGETRLYIDDIVSISCDYEGAQALKILHSSDE